MSGLEDFDDNVSIAGHYQTLDGNSAYDDAKSYFKSKWVWIVTIGLVAAFAFGFGVAAYAKNDDDQGQIDSLKAALEGNMTMDKMLVLIEETSSKVGSLENKIDNADLDMIIKNTEINSAFSDEETARQVRAYERHIAEMHKRDLKEDPEYARMVANYERSTGKRFLSFLFRRFEITRIEEDGVTVLDEIENSQYRRLVWKGLLAQSQTIPNNVLSYIDMSYLVRDQIVPEPGADPVIIPSTVKAEIANASIVVDPRISFPVQTQDASQFKPGFFSPATVIKVNNPGVYDVEAKIQIRTSNYMLAPLKITANSDVFAQAVVSGANLGNNVVATMIKNTLKIQGEFAPNPPGPPPPAPRADQYQALNLRGSFEVELVDTDTGVKSRHVAYVEYPLVTFNEARPIQIPAAIATISGVRRLSLSANSNSTTFVTEIPLPAFEGTPRLDFSETVNVWGRAFLGSSESFFDFSQTSGEYPSEKVDASDVYFNSGDQNTIYVRLSGLNVKDTGEVALYMQHSLPGDIDIFLADLSILNVNTDTKILPRVDGLVSAIQPPGFKWFTSYEDLEDDRK